MTTDSRDPENLRGSIRMPNNTGLRFGDRVGLLVMGVLHPTDKVLVYGLVSDISSDGSVVIVDYNSPPSPPKKTEYIRKY